MPPNWYQIQSSIPVINQNLCNWIRLQLSTIARYSDVPRASWRLKSSGTRLLLQAAIDEIIEGPFYWQFVGDEKPQILKAFRESNRLLILLGLALSHYTASQNKWLCFVQNDATNCLNFRYSLFHCTKVFLIAIPFQSYRDIIHNAVQQ